MKKSILALTLAAILAMSIGCSNSNQQTPPQNEQSTSNQTQQETTNTETSSTDSEGLQPGYLSTRDTPVTLKWYANYSWFSIPNQESYVHQEMARDTGVTIEYIVPTGNETERLQTMIVSGDLPDFLTMSWSENIIGELIDAGLVEPLNVLADTYDPYFHNVAKIESLNWFRQPNGNVYGLPDNSFTEQDRLNGAPFYSNQSFLVHREMYEALGSPDMSTPEGFLNALSEAKAQFPTVNGQSLIPFGTHEFTENGSISFLDFLQGFLAIPHEIDGRLIDREEHPEYVRWMKVFREANEMDLIATDIFVDKRSQMAEKLVQERYFSMLYQWPDLPEEALYTYIPVTGPKNANGDPHTLSPSAGIQGWNQTFISTNSKNKDRAIQYLTYRLSDEGLLTVFMGREGETFDFVDGKPVMRQELVDMYYNDRAAFTDIWGLQNSATWLGSDWIAAGARGYVLPEREINQMMINWTSQYTVNNSAYSFNPFEVESEAAIINQRLEAERGKVLPQLIRAETEEKFDEIWNNYLQFKRDNNIDLILEMRQEEMENNKIKLGIN